MKGLTTYKRTTRIKLKSIAESKKIDEVFIKHYTHILEHFDDIIAKHDEDITEIEEKKAEIVKQFIEAPQLLKELNQHLAELAKKRGNITEKDGKVKRVKHLRERLEVLIRECELDGIDVDEIQDAAKEAEREEAIKKATADTAKEQEAAAKDAVELI